MSDEEWDDERLQEDLNYAVNAGALNAICSLCKHIIDAEKYPGCHAGVCPHCGKKTEFLYATPSQHN